PGLIGKSVDRDSDRAVGGRKAGEQDLGLRLVGNVGLGASLRKRGAAVFGDRRAGGERECGDGCESGLQVHEMVPHQFTSTKVGTTIVVTSPVSSSVMVSVTSVSPRTKSIVWPPKLMVPRSCGLSPKIASTICEDRAERSRDCSWRAKMSAWLLVLRAFGSL